MFNRYFLTLTRHPVLLLTLIAVVCLASIAGIHEGIMRQAAIDLHIKLVTDPYWQAGPQQ